MFGNTFNNHNHNDTESILLVLLEIKNTIEKNTARLDELSKKYDQTIGI